VAPPPVTWYRSGSSGRKESGSGQQGEQGVATTGPDGKHIIAAGELGAFSVCPLAWKLKYIDKQGAAFSLGEKRLGMKLHRDWSRMFDESLVLGQWIRYLAVLTCTALVVFILLNPQGIPVEQLLALSVRNHGLQLVLLVGAALLVIRSFSRAAGRRRRASGFEPESVTVSIEGSKILEEREYVSRAQGLAGKPDALIEEGGLIIPVERKPLAKKLRDRYVAQILVYMRLVEEFEGKKPPHGYLLIGPSCRRIKVENTDAKQQWVQALIDQMRAMLDGGEVRPSPHPIKCSKCDVRHRCPARADRGDAAAAPQAADEDEGSA